MYVGGNHKVLWGNKQAYHFHQKMKANTRHKKMGVQLLTKSLFHQNKNHGHPLKCMLHQSVKA